jgi:hypothetical protein
MTQSAEQLEREVGKARNRLGADLDELRLRITPGQVVDQIADYAREGPAAEFVGNLGREIRQNPLPLLLTAAGIGWLIIASGRSRSTAIRDVEAMPGRRTSTVPAPVAGSYELDEAADATMAE